MNTSRPVRAFAAAIACALAAAAAGQAAEQTVPLSELDLAKMSSGWGKPLADRAVTDNPLSIGGERFDRGVGTHAESALWVDLHGQAKRLSARVGIDDHAGAGKGSVEFLVIVDGKRVFRSGLMKAGDAAKAVDVDLTGGRSMLLVADSAGDGIDFDHADWAEAEIVYAGQAPVAADAPQEEKVVLTPKPGPEPAIHGPRLFGVRPGRPLIYRIPCTGERPMRFAVDGLPPGLSVDGATGIITGAAPASRGNYAVTLRASNARGEAEKPFTLVVGDTLALTPPMGWNSWYIHYSRVTEKHMREAADRMVESSMADFGYMYVNIDDCWMKRKGDEPYRDESGAVLPNAKFPDVPGMVEYIHGKGLRAGLYTSPGPWTCAGYVGAYEHEQSDAERFAKWGFDFLKYDWCSYGGVAGGKSLADLQRPYRKMSAILKTLDRDIVLNLCQYGMGEVWKWGGEVGGNCWRTTGDLGLARGGRLPGFYHIGLSNAQHWQYARPGEWNDPDYLLIGWVGNARGMGEGRPTALSGDEQYSYMSMWCLMAAPLVFSGDMARLDEFTLNVLCNAEVIDVDQDALGKQARIVAQGDDALVLAKPMEDGSLAIGLFNLGEVRRPMSVAWKDLGVAGKRRARDLWRQTDLGTVEDRFTAEVNRHGVALVRLSPETN